MKALSLWQPWASAIALGLKRVETRHWSTKYRGPLIIHAAKRWTREERVMAEAHGLFALPLGMIVASANLVEVLPSERIAQMVGNQELAWGNYGPGRFGWLLDDIQPLAPVPFRGAQGFFDVPEDLVLPL